MDTTYVWNLSELNKSPEFKTIEIKDSVYWMPQDVNLIYSFTITFNKNLHKLIFIWGLTNCFIHDKQAKLHLKKSCCNTNAICDQEMELKPSHSYVIGFNDGEACQGSQARNRVGTKSFPIRYNIITPVARKWAQNLLLGT